MSMLQGTHILVVDPDADRRDKICTVLRRCRAVVHLAESRTEALGQFAELYGQQIVPRAVVTSWQLHPPGTREHQFYQMIHRHVDNTALDLVERIRTIDGRIALAVLSTPEDQIPDNVVEAFRVTLVPRIEDLEEVLSSDPDMLSMRYHSPDYVRDEVYREAAQELNARS